MFFIKGTSGRTDIYVMCEPGEMNPARGEKNVRENEFPEQKYYRFQSDKLTDIRHASDLELDLYIAGVRLEQANRNNSDTIIECDNNLREASENLEKFILDISSNVELVTSREVKKELELWDFCKSSETHKSYYYKKEDDLNVFLVKGNITAEDDSKYGSFESRFIDIQKQLSCKLTMAERKIERAALWDEVMEYAVIRNHDLFITPYNRYFRLYAITKENLYDLSADKNKKKQERVL